MSIAWVILTTRLEDHRMHRRTSFLVAYAFSPVLMGCATTLHAPAAAAPTIASAAARSTGPSLRSATCPGVRCGAEVAVQEDAPPIEGHPLTSVVVTQCNLIVAVYMTMPDGRLLRFDQSASLPADKLLILAYAAARSERVEVACDATGTPGEIVGYEKHGPV